MPKGVYIRNKPPWNKGLTKDTDSRVVQYAERNTEMPNTPEHIEASRQAMLACWQNPEFRARQLKLRNTKAFKEKRCQRMLGENNPRFGKPPWNKGKTGCYSEEVLQKMGVASRGKPSPMKGKHFPPEVVEKSRQGLLRKWQDPEYVAMQMKARGVKPNKLEETLTDIIERHELPFKYVGDGQFILGGKCPDFLNVDGRKQLIELFGLHWHDIFDVARKTEHFEQYGFQTLIIWEDEIKTLPEAAIVERIRKFSRRKGVSHGMATNTTGPNIY